MGIKVAQAAAELDAWIDEQRAEGERVTHFDLDDEFLRRYPDATPVEGKEVAQCMMDMVRARLAKLRH